MNLLKATGVVLLALVLAWALILSLESEPKSPSLASVQLDSLRIELAKVEEGDFVRMSGRWYRVEENRKDKDFTLAIWVLPNEGKPQSIFLAFPEDVARVDEIARKNVEPRLWYEAEAQYLSLPVWQK